MRRFLAILIVTCGAVAVIPASADVMDMVDIGVPASELGHNMVGWGDIQYGDLHDPTGPYGDVVDCRGIDCPVSLGDGDISALIMLDFGTEPDGNPRCITLRHLEGQAVDAFDLYVYDMGGTPPGELIFSYPGDEVNTELQWHTTTLQNVCAGGPCVLHFVSTASHWSGWSTYGQMYFDWISVECDLALPVVPSTWSQIKALYN